MAEANNTPRLASRGCSWMAVLGVVFAGLVLANSVLIYGLCNGLRDAVSPLKNAKVFQAVVFAGTIFVLGLEVTVYDRVLTWKRKRGR